MNLTQEGRDFFKSQGMESKIDKMVKMNSLFVVRADSVAP